MVSKAERLGFEPWDPEGSTVFPPVAPPVAGQADPPLADETARFTFNYLSYLYQKQPL